ncbi:hypothetical protein TNCV_2770661 [Trichonephila clavipes]|nr:hypothetical protein TNCV_2770661 [Trichonephila clavipes]
MVMDGHSRPRPSRAVVPLSLSLATTCSIEGKDKSLNNQFIHKSSENVGASFFYRKRRCCLRLNKCAETKQPPHFLTRDKKQSKTSEATREGRVSLRAVLLNTEKCLKFHENFLLLWLECRRSGLVCAQELRESSEEMSVKVKAIVMNPEEGNPTLEECLGHGFSILVRQELKLGRWNSCTFQRLTASFDHSIVEYCVFLQLSFTKVMQGCLVIGSISQEPEVEVQDCYEST